MSKDIKVKLLELPKSIIHSILGYLSAKELIFPFLQVSKKFTEFALDPSILTNAFFNQIKVPFCYGGKEFESLKIEEKVSVIKDILWSGGTNEKLPITAYFTDGGGQENDMGKYFISNIYTDNPANLYCSRRGENVSIKAICSEGVSQHIDFSDPKKYLIPESKASCYRYSKDTYYYPVQKAIAANDPQNRKHFGVIKYHDLNRNLSGYTCFLKNFVVFISMEEIDTSHPIVQLFDGVKKLEQVQQLGFDYMSLQDTEDTKVVEFTLSSTKKVEDILQKNIPGAKLNGVYPFIWGDISGNTTNYLNIVQRIGFRYILFKLIDSTKTQSGDNIDCYTVSISGSYVKLKFSHEE